MAPERKDELRRWATLLGFLAGLISLIAAARAAGDDRYVKQADYRQDLSEMKSDLRVLRCRVAGDCK